MELHKQFDDRYYASTIPLPRIFFLVWYKIQNDLNFARNIQFSNKAFFSQCAADPSKLLFKRNKNLW